jgi:hypothetical protein
MVLRKLTRSVIVSVAGLLMLAGGAINPVECGTGSCCCMPETTDDLALQQGHCGCGCGAFEESQVPDQSAVTLGLSEIKPAETKFDYIVEIDSDIFENINSCFGFQERFTHSPPLILDNKYKPLLC